MHERQPVTVDLRTRVRDLEATLARTQDNLRVAEERAQLAEKAARDAWQFAKAMTVRGRPDA